MAIPMLKIRRPNGRLIFNMEIAIRRYDGLYIETGPRSGFVWRIQYIVVAVDYHRQDLFQPSRMCHNTVA